MEINVKDIRKRLGLTQEALAIKLGVDRRTVINYEKGEKIPDSKVKLFHFIFENLNNEENINIASEPKENEYQKVKNDALESSMDQEIEVFTNKNNVKFLIFPDDTYKIEVSMIPFKAYASADIECYFDEDYKNKEFKKIQFSVDKIGKGNYLAFKSQNNSMNGGGIYDTPSGAEILAREIGRQYWTSLHKNELGFILMTKNAIRHKDIIKYNEETGMFTLHSRNPDEKDFEESINDVYKIFNVIKRTF